MERTKKDSVEEYVAHYNTSGHRCTCVSDNAVPEAQEPATSSSAAIAVGIPSRLKLRLTVTL